MNVQVFQLLMGTEWLMARICERLNEMRIAKETRHFAFMKEGTAEHQRETNSNIPSKKQTSFHQVYHIYAIFQFINTAKRNVSFI